MPGRLSSALEPRRHDPYWICSVLCLLFGHKAGTAHSFSGLLFTEAPFPLRRELPHGSTKPGHVLHRAPAGGRSCVLFAPQTTHQRQAHRRRTQGRCRQTRRLQGSAQHPMYRCTALQPNQRQAAQPRQRRSATHAHLCLPRAPPCRLAHQGSPCSVPPPAPASGAYCPGAGGMDTSSVHTHTSPCASKGGSLLSWLCIGAQSARTAASSSSSMLSWPAGARGPPAAAFSIGHSSCGSLRSNQGSCFGREAWQTTPFPSFARACAANRAIELSVLTIRAKECACPPNARKINDNFL